MLHQGAMAVVVKLENGKMARLLCNPETEVAELREELLARRQIKEDDAILFRGLVVCSRECHKKIGEIGIQSEQMLTIISAMERERRRAPLPTALLTLSRSQSSASANNLQEAALSQSKSIDVPIPRSHSTGYLQDTTPSSPMGGGNSPTGKSKSLLMAAMREAKMSLSELDLDWRNTNKAGHFSSSPRTSERRSTYVSHAVRRSKSTDFFGDQGDTDASAASSPACGGEDSAFSPCTRDMDRVMSESCMSQQATPPSPSLGLELWARADKGYKTWAPPPRPLGSVDLTISPERWVSPIVQRNTYVSSCSPGSASCWGSPASGPTKPSSPTTRLSRVGSLTQTNDEFARSFSSPGPSHFAPCNDDDSLDEVLDDMSAVVAKAARAIDEMSRQMETLQQSARVIRNGTILTPARRGRGSSERLSSITSESMG
mmetsp:Transcript_1305/g.2848  ORF Transcript_1305/g.2848 Transcript_1305/m.2848 type:complete len:431 (+) Transcript_1305:27-1319(+)